jgi:alpha-glucosidase
MNSSKHGNRIFDWRLKGVLLLALLGAGWVRAQDNVEKTEWGWLIKLGPAQVELAAVNADTLRLSVASNGAPAVASSSSFLTAPVSHHAEWRRVKVGGCVGIHIGAGELLVNPTNGEWTLKNAAGQVVIPPHQIGDLSGARFTEDSQIGIQLGWDKTQPIPILGCGNGVDSLEQTQAVARVANGRAVIPYYWSAAGYAVLGVTADDNLPAQWQGVTPAEYGVWTFPGVRADLYLMPAASLKDAAGAYARLTGAAPVPPRWAFGYLQSRWGWQGRAYIEDTLKHFHDLQIPVDAFIFDFEWYTVNPDYALPANGQPNFDDFGWNTNLFNEPAKQIADYRSQGVRFVGIRKPRLGNSDSLVMMREKHWGVDVRDAAQFQTRDINFRNPDVRQWYVNQSSNLWQAGVDGWWNDEGESRYTTYYYWNLAEQQALNRYRPGQRLWSLNRAYSPGTQRLGAGAWTGDVKASWKVLAATPVSLLNWSLAGMPYGACDIGGFFNTPSPELLTRWMEAGVFFPIMRAHSTFDVPPHFPWLYGPEALAAMRQAIDLRYRLIPFYYSLAHETCETGIPWMRPLVMEFPGDPRTANLSDEWMMGRSLLVAPVLHVGGQRSVYLPAGGWYAFESNHRLPGNQTLEVTARLEEIPLYVRAGSILPLGPVIQHTSQLPGGALELQIYPGQDATFTLVEDDGETTGYLKGNIRRTTFKWQDDLGRLSWKSSGRYAGPDVFKNYHVVLFDASGKIEAEGRLGTHGQLNLHSLPGHLDR